MGRTRQVDLGRKAYLTDGQWDRIKGHFPDLVMTSAGGRPPHSSRACREVILFVLLTGCPWEYLPDYSSSCVTCWRRFNE